MTSLAVTKDGQPVKSEAWTFDAKGNQLTYLDPAGVLTTKTFDGQDNVLTQVVSKNGVTVTSEAWTYDANNNPLTYLAPDGVLTSKTFDALGRVTSQVVSKNGQMIKSEAWTFDAKGDQLSYTDPVSIKTLQTFDEQDRVLTRIVKDASGLTVQSEAWTYDPSGNVLSYTAPDHFTTFTTYDVFNDVLSRTEKNAAGQTVQSESATFDAEGHELTHTGPDGIVTTRTFDDLNRLVALVETQGSQTLKSEAWTFDVSGNELSHSDAAGNVFTSTWDALGRKNHQEVRDKNNLLVDQQDWTYDPSGHVLSHTDNDGKVTSTLYDALDRKVQEEVRNAQNVLVSTETWTYDADSHLIAHVDPLGRETRTAYDAEGRKTSETIAYGTAQAATTLYGHDAAGNLLSLTDAAGNITSFTYDDAGNKTSMTDPQGHTVFSTYDADGRMTSSTDREGRRRDFVYDAEGRLLTEKWFDAVGTLTETLAYTYDADGRMLTAGNHVGTYTFHYDERGRLTGVDEPFGLTLAFAYDASGNRTQVTDSFGGMEQSTYDAANRLVSRLFTQAGLPTLRIDQSYDVLGRLAQQTRYSDAAGTQVVAENAYTYDASGQIIDLVYKNAGGATLAGYHFTFDVAGQLTAQTDHGVTRNYTYDDQGQLTSDGTNTISYGANGNRTGTGNVTGTANQLTSDGTWNYTYDLEGDMTKKVGIASGETWNYGYDNANHLTHVEKRASDGGTLEMQADYQYDVFGNRIEKDVTTPSAGTVTTKYAQDKWNPALPTPVGNENFNAWAILNGDNTLQTRNLYGDQVDQLLARIDVGISGSTASWYLTDRQGSIRDVVDSSGVVKDSITYDGFGNITSETNAANRGHYAWTGREIDTETSLQYNRARYYDSTTGRWISQDPMGFDAGDSNLYRYVHNRPTSWTDPSGYQEGGPVNPQQAVKNWRENFSNGSSLTFEEEVTMREKITEYKVKLARTRDGQKEILDTITYLEAALNARQTNGNNSYEKIKSTLRFDDPHDPLNAPPQITFIPISVQQGGITNNNRTIGRDAALEAEHEASMQIARMVPVIGSLIIIGDAGQAAGFHLIDQSRKIAGGEFQGAAKAQGVYGIALYYNLAKGSNPLLLLLPDRTGIPEALQNADPRAAERGGKVAEGVKSGGDLVAFFVPFSSAKIAGNAPGSGQLFQRGGRWVSPATAEELYDAGQAYTAMLRHFRANGGIWDVQTSLPGINRTWTRTISGRYRFGEGTASIIEIRSGATYSGPRKLDHQLS